MELDAFLIHFDEFCREFEIDMSPQARFDKLIVEVCELCEAQGPGRKDDESLDVLVCAIANCKARGLHDMLHLAFLKLERTAIKYRETKGEWKQEPLL
jgi:hypothetical protein